jgi:hypothetical protein
LQGGTSARVHKLPIDENFASEIFRSESCAGIVAAQQMIPPAGQWANQIKGRSRASLPFVAEERVGR